MSIFSEENGLKKHICEIGKRLWMHGFVAATNSNISIRSNETEVLSPNSVSKGFITPDMISKVDLEGCRDSQQFGLIAK